MKLLIITQKVDKNDDVLGFFHDWILEFSRNVEAITVICLQKGEYDLPGNVRVFSLGKENFPLSPARPGTFHFRFFKKIRHVLIFWKHIWSERGNYDAVFVHMNPEYVILGGLLWKFLNKKIGIWYVHKSVDLKLRLAEKLADFIFSASSESFRLSSRKINLVGHGIDVGKFNFADNHESVADIISVGRISPIKNYEVLIEAVRMIKDRDRKIEVRIAGGPVFDSDKIYLNNLEKKIEEYGLTESFRFIGGIPHSEIQDFYKKSRIFVNFSGTGSVDKAVLEAMASGLLVLTSNEAFRGILSDRYFTSNDPSVIADKLIKLMESGIDPNLRKYVEENHGLKSLIKKILNIYGKADR